MFGTYNQIDYPGSKFSQVTENPDFKYFLPILIRLSTNNFELLFLMVLFYQRILPLSGWFGGNCPFVGDTPFDPPFVTPFVPVPFDDKKPDPSENEEDWGKLLIEKRNSFTILHKISDNNIIPIPKEFYAKSLTNN